jgi:hypothetical protein
MSLLPKEHGAYGQIAVPLITAFLVAGVSTTGLLIATAVSAGFLAHEPASVLTGARGTRAKRDLRQPALRWLGSTQRRFFRTPAECFARRVRLTLCAGRMRATTHCKAPGIVVALRLAVAAIGLLASGQ